MSCTRQHSPPRSTASRADRLARPAYGQARVLVADDDATEPSLSADGRTLAFARDGDGWRTPTALRCGRSWPRITPGGPLYPRWAAIAFSGDGLTAIESTAREAEDSIPAARRRAGRRWSQDRVRRKTAPNRHQRGRLRSEAVTSPGRRNDGDPAWSLDGRMIASSATAMSI